MQRSDANRRLVVRHVLNAEKPQWTGASAEYKPEDPEDFKKNGQFPCIIHWNFNHFVVLNGFKKAKLF